MKEINTNVDALTIKQNMNTKSNYTSVSKIKKYTSPYNNPYEEPPKNPIQTEEVDLNIDEIKSSRVPAEEIMVDTESSNTYVPIQFDEPDDPTEKESYNRAKQMNKEVQDIFERNGIKVEVIYDYRPLDSGIGYANSRSHHRTGRALDIVPQDGDFEALRDFLLHNEEMRAYLESNDLGVIDETHQCVLDHTGGPTEHFHIGPDKMAKRMYKGWESLEPYCDEIRNAQSEEEIQKIQKEMTNKLKSWEFRDYEIQAFFEDADQMLEE